MQANLKDKEVLSTDHPNTNGTRRTTILLRPDDEASLRALSNSMGTTDTESIRRALRLMSELMTWQAEGGKVVLERGRLRETIRFL